MDLATLISYMTWKF